MLFFFLMFCMSKLSDLLRAIDELHIAAPRFLTRGELYSVCNAQSPAEVGNFYPLPPSLGSEG